MIRCPACSSEQKETSKFCSACGAALDPKDAATVAHRAGASATGRDAPSSLSDTSHHGRFLPGTRIADRYRIVSLVGRGGMGEVYRADDLKLGHTVALKFLPENLAGDPQRLELFHNEVRLTRQISHPNVCRVFDIGETDGQQFLSMEYIDGEDLKALLRRIGRLPQDKGVQIAQQLCAGLAAAHDQGVLHRDLKPANIMIDGQGHVRITDFGLAKLAADSGAGEIAGTPAYMAPEQLARGEATIQSDLYSLGLILYELFTGRAVHQGGSIHELMQAHEESSVSHPSHHVRDFDPAVERAILRCLEKLPHERPKTAQAVAAALPGGDPLAAALAAGETPSPEMVAAAGESGRLSLWAGGGLFAAVCACLVAIPLVADSMDAFRLEQLADHEPATLKKQATDLIAALGHPVHRAGSVHGFELNEHTRQFLREFWYRQRSGSLVPDIPQLTLLPFSWRVTSSNPARGDPGMITVRLDPAGNLIELLAVPRPDERAGNVSLSPNDLFAAAGLGPTEQFDAVSPAERPPGALPPLYADRPQVWRIADNPPEFVTMATRGGRVVYFRRFHAKGPAGDDTGGWLGKQWGNGMTALNQIGLMLVALWLALRNVRRGKADIRGGLRFALYFLTIDVVLWAVAVQHGGSPDRALVFALNYFVRSLAYSLRVWLYYVALEPLVRRFWPDILISWSRLMSGRYRDPRIGSDLLVGCLFGAAWVFAVSQPFGLLSGTVETGFDFGRYYGRGRDSQ